MSTSEYVVEALSRVSGEMRGAPSGASALLQGASGSGFAGRTSA